MGKKNDSSLLSAILDLKKIEAVAADSLPLKLPGNRLKLMQEQNNETNNRNHKAVQI